jgi:hypothetical protein
MIWKDQKTEIREFIYPRRNNLWQKVLEVKAPRAAWALGA